LTLFIERGYNYPMKEDLTYFLFKNSVVLNFESNGSVKTETISSDDPRYKEIISLLNNKSYGDIPDVVHRGMIKELLRFK
jgi:hypothetical protein